MRIRHLTLLLSMFAVWTASAESYTIDPRHTFPAFEVSHYGFSLQRGRFNKLAGKLDLDASAKKGSVEITIDTSSVDMGLRGLEQAHARRTIFPDRQVSAGALRRARFRLRCRQADAGKRRTDPARSHPQRGAQGFPVALRQASDSAAPALRRGSRNHHQALGFRHEQQPSWHRRRGSGSPSPSKHSRTS
jgi:hypothetical protein